MAEIKKTGHKDFGGNKHSAEVFARWLRLRTYHTNADPTREGGLVTNKEGRPVGWFRGPFWRSIKNDPHITTADIRPIVEYNNALCTNPQSGSELELNAINENGETANIADPDHPVYRMLTEHNLAITNGTTIGFTEADDYDTQLAMSEKTVGFSPELGRYCIELNFAPGLESNVRNRRFLYALKTLIKVSHANNVLICPLSALPHRHLNHTDTNQHPYVQRMAFEFMGWERVRHFISSSFQTHVEMLTLEAALSAVNYMEFVTPILYAATASAPFLGGEIMPDLQETYTAIPDIATNKRKLETYQQLEPHMTHSYRYLSRFFGSPSGGVMKKPLPETSNEFWRKAAHIIQTGESPTIGRVSGHHTNFRIRPDLLPYGTIESAYLDTAGAKVEKLIALQEFTKTLGWKLQLYAHYGKLDEVRQRWPELFGSIPSTETFAQVHRNTITVAQEGNSAYIKTMNSKTRSVKKLFQQLVEFVQTPFTDTVRDEEYNGLPAGIIQELAASYEDPYELMTLYKDENGITSVKGYYETGVGTLSQWLLARAHELVANGMEESEAIKNCSVDTGTSFHYHVLTITSEQLNSLYN